MFATVKLLLLFLVHIGFDYAITNKIHSTKSNV